MDWKNKYNDVLDRARKELQACGSTDCDAARQIFRFFPELKEDEDELTWLKNYISEEAYYLSIDIRDDDDSIKLKNLQRSLAWLEKQGKNNTGISEATRQKLEDNLNKALEKETPESWNEFLDKQAMSKSNWKPTEEQYEALTYAYHLCSDTDSGNYHEYVLGTLIEDLHRLDDQHPKFRIGDTIKKKSTGDIVTISVVDLKNREYRLSNSGFIPFKYEDLWELVQLDPTDKVEPEFHEGEWIVSSNGVYWHIDAIQDGRYQISASGTVAIVDWPLDTKNYHKWTIDDAKEGDVLLSPSIPEGDKGCPFIFKEIDKNGVVRFHAALLHNSGEELRIDDNCRNVMEYAHAGYHVPATKEQRDHLFKMMEKNGYKWDSDEKKLKKIGEQNPTDKVEPKFKVGDKIFDKDFDECDCWTIIDIKDGKYIFDDGQFIWINGQDLWELVKQNPTDNAEPKFKVDDWVVTSYGEVSQVISVDKDCDGYTLDNGNYFSGSWCDTYHLWTIADAKDGDIIYAKSRDNTLDFICIFSKLENEKSWIYCSVYNYSNYLGNDLKYWGFDDCAGFINLYNYDFHPATKKTT